jgi:hypothetical protein
MKQTFTLWGMLCPYLPAAGHSNRRKVRPGHLGHVGLLPHHRRALSNDAHHLRRPIPEAH